MGCKNLKVLRLVVLVGVVTCSPLPDNLTPPAATAPHHQHASPHSNNQPITTHDSPPHSLSVNPSSSAQIDVTHEIRHVTYEVSEEVRGDDLTTPDVPEDDPPIPTATTPPALPDPEIRSDNVNSDIGFTDIGQSDNVNSDIGRSDSDGHFDQGPLPDDLDINQSSASFTPQSDAPQSTTEEPQQENYKAYFRETQENHREPRENHETTLENQENHREPRDNHQNPLENHQTSQENHQNPQENQEPQENHQEPRENHEITHENHQTPQENHRGPHVNHRAYFQEPRTVDGEAKTVDYIEIHSKDSEKVDSELRESESESDPELLGSDESSKSRVTVIESLGNARNRDSISETLVESHGRDSVEKDPSIESVEKDKVESVEKDAHVESIESNENETIESIEKETSELVEKEPHVESIEKDKFESVEKDNVESVEKDPHVESIESVENPSIESGEKYPFAELIEKHPIAVKSGEKQLTQTEPLIRDANAEVVVVRKDDAVVENVAGQRYSDDSIDIDSSLSKNSDDSSDVDSENRKYVDGKDDSEDDSKDSDVDSENRKYVDGSDSEDDRRDDGRDDGKDDSIVQSPSHHHHHQQEDAEGSLKVIEKDDGVPIIDVRKEDSSEEKASIENHKDNNNEKKNEEPGENHTLEQGSDTNDVRTALARFSHTEVRTLNHDTPNHGPQRRINVWEGAEDSSEGEEGRHERKTRPEEVPIFIQDNSGPIDIVQRSDGHRENDAEVLETSASEFSEVRSEEEGSEEGRRKSRIFIEPPTGLEVWSMTSPTPITPSEGGDEGESLVEGEAQPKDTEELEATNSPQDDSSEEIVSGEEDESGSEEVDEGDVDEGVVVEGEVVESPVVPEPSSEPPQDYTDTYGDIITGAGLPDFSVTQEDIPHPQPDPPPIPSNRDQSGDSSYLLPPKEEQVSVAAPDSLTPGCIVAIVFGVIVSLAIITGIGGFVIYQRRTLNRPKALGSDRGYAGSDSLGYLDDQVHVSYVNSQVDSTKGSPEDLISLDMDSDFFLNSLESMTIQNLWPENVRHTKL